MLSISAFYSFRHYVHPAQKRNIYDTVQGKYILYLRGKIRFIQTVNTCLAFLVTVGTIINAAIFTVTCCSRSLHSWNATFQGVYWQILNSHRIHTRMSSKIKIISESWNKTINCQQVSFWYLPYMNQYVWHCNLSFFDIKKTRNIHDWYV